MIQAVARKKKPEPEDVFHINFDISKEELRTWKPERVFAFFVAISQLVQIRWPEDDQDLTGE